MRVGEEMETTAPKLPIFSIPQLQSPFHTGMLTPPLHTTTSSIPFKWEEKPGKPIPNTTNKTITTKGLELPPRLLLDAKITKIPSPTTVLEGPYYIGKASLQSSSFRLIREFHDDDEEGQFGEMGVKKRGQKGLFKRFWGRRVLKIKGKRDVGEDNFVFSSFLDVEDGCSYGSEGGTSTSIGVKMTRRNRSCLDLSHPKSNIFAKIYESFKRSIPWGRKQSLKKA